MGAPRQRPVLLYDGACGFCNATIQFILKRDRRGTLRFAPLSSPYAERALATHPEIRGIDSVVWLELADDRPLTRSAAGLRVAGYLGGLWRLALIFWVVPPPIRDWVYDLVARHRHLLIAGSPHCVVTPPEARDRFLDIE
jgi:predicted DCC family thiol-disulfide oxidoreductase YuxK